MTDSTVDLRERLVEQRERLIEALARSPQLEPGWLNLLGIVQSAICAVDEARS